MKVRICLRSFIKNDNTIYTDIALEHFQNQQESLYDEFQLKNGLGLKIQKIYKEEMNKLIESKEILKDQLDVMISKLLLKKDTRDGSNYTDLKYTVLRSIIVNYVTLYQKVERIEHVYKGAFDVSK